MDMAGTVNTHYPSFNVLDRMERWDAHTQEIVRRRLGNFPAPTWLTEREARYIALIARHIVYENREDIISWIVRHIDEKLSGGAGENQRRVGTPPERILIREGLNALDHLARVSYKKYFGDLDDDQQFALLARLQQGQAAALPEWSYIPQQELFNKLASEIIAAYYAHPTVWSEIGYGGPVYPDIYVRIELGLTDPWEAKRNGKQG